MKVEITGRITALHSRTWNEHDRKIQPFKVDADTPWIEIVDEAIDRTYPDGNFEQFEDAIVETEVAS